MATFLCCVYLAASEWVPLLGSKGEILLFPKGHFALKLAQEDEESRFSRSSELLGTKTSEKSRQGLVRKQPQNQNPFLWDRLTYDIQTEKGPRRLLKGIKGWVGRGTLTAVMV